MTPDREDLLARVRRQAMSDEGISDAEMADLQAQRAALMKIAERDGGPAAIRAAMQGAKRPTPQRRPDRGAEEDAARAAMASLMEDAPASARPAPNRPLMQGGIPASTNRNSPGVLSRGAVPTPPAGAGAQQVMQALAAMAAREQGDAGGMVAEPEGLPQVAPPTAESGGIMAALRALLGGGAPQGRPSWQGGMPASTNRNSPGVLRR